MAEILITLTIICYLGLMLMVGYISSKKTKSVEEFYLGGRTLGPFVTAMSAEASDMSSWLLMGLPAVAYVTGIADAGWTAIGLATGTYLNWKYIAPRLRSFSHTVDAITIPSFFARRYADHKHRIGALSSLIIIVFFVPYTASAFAACGKLFSTLFDVGYISAMLTSAMIILVYTVSGGFLAVSFTDLIQSIVMSVALFFVLSYSITSVGGFSVIIEHNAQLEGYLSMFHSHNPDTLGSTPYPILNIISTFAWGLGYFGMPHILLRFMAIQDENKLPVAKTVATTWVVFSMIVAILIGMAGNTMTYYSVLPPLEDPETIIISLANLVSQHSNMYATIAGLILAGILAATMSTADSQLLVASSSVSQNLISEFMGKNLSPKHSMIVARVSIVVISIFGAYLARDPDSSVFGIVSFAWAGFGASFGPVMLLSLFWKRGNLQGALAGMFSGGATVFFWKYVLAPKGGIFAIYELLPAFLVGLGVMVLVSLLTPPPNNEVDLIYEASLMPVPTEPYTSFPRLAKGKKGKKR